MSRILLNLSLLRRNNENESSIDYTDSQKKVEVIARERIQNFMFVLSNLIITPQKIINLWFNFCGRGQNVFFDLKTMSCVTRER